MLHVNVCDTPNCMKQDVEMTVTLEIDQFSVFSGSQFLNHPSENILLSYMKITALDYEW